jgi:hypothetical protein
MIAAKAGMSVLKCEAVFTIAAADSQATSAMIAKTTAAVNQRQARPVRVASGM